MILFAAIHAAGQSSVIDKVCMGTQRHYRIDGEPNSTYLWQLADSLGNSITLTNPSGTSFTATDSISGLPTVGSEQIVTWNSPGNYTLKAIQYSSAGCDTIQQAEIRVAMPPTTFAGDTLISCPDSPVALNKATAQNYSTLAWTSSGDGIFDDPSVLHPNYTAGPSDRSVGNVILTLTAQPETANEICGVSQSAVFLTFKNQIALITIGADQTTVTTGTTVNFTATPINGGATPIYQWQVNGLNVGSNSPNYSYAPADSDSIRVVMTSSEICIAGSNATSNSISIKVEKALEASVTITADQNNVCSGTLISFTAIPIHGGASPNYHWKVNGLAVGTDAPNFTYTPNNGDTIRVIMAVAETGIIGSPATSNAIIIQSNAIKTPTFAPIEQLILNSTAPNLPTTSQNGITGTWNPSVINTAVAGKTDYSFTPDEGQCALTTKISIEIISKITPLFSLADRICQNSIAPTLPSTSTNGVRGTWNPTSINTAQPGLIIAIFTPDNELNAVPITLEINITAQIAPTFSPIASLCKNAVAPSLPFTSLNGIIGSWSPTTISTTTVGITNYTFTPDEGQCGASTSLAIEITDLIPPIFTFDKVICQNSTPPTLPLTSTNGIRGNWSPSVINTAASGSATYTFTPNGGQCAAAIEVIVEIHNPTAPIFAPIPAICQNSTAANLPSTSTNGIHGSWSPTIINTSTTGTSNYIFTPDVNSCATTAILSITIVGPTTLTFNPIEPICQNTTALTLPTQSTNSPSIAGTWIPSSISTSLVGQSTYTFSPTAGSCALQADIQITIKKPVTPTFAQLGPYIQNDLPQELVVNSINGISGAWSPAKISTTTAGEATYTFTPAANSCATTAAMTIRTDIQAVISEVDSLPKSKILQIGSCTQVNLDASKSAGNSLAYQWAILDAGGSLSSLTGIRSTFKINSDYQGRLPALFRVRLTISDQQGFTSSDTLTIQVNELPRAEVTSNGTLSKDGSMVVDGTLSTGDKLSYQWSTAVGDIIGAKDKPTVQCFGAGLYRLIVTDRYGCQNVKDFNFPLELYHIEANADHYRMTWAQDSILQVLDNDISTVAFSSIRIINPPMLGNASLNADLTISYKPTTKKPGHDQFAYEVCNIANICDSTLVSIDISDSPISFPEGFSPNGDGANDLFIIKGLLNYPISELYVFNRSGQKVYENLDYQNNWDGRMVNQELVPTGTYYYILKLGITNRIIKSYVYIGY